MRGAFVFSIFIMASAFSQSLEKSYLLNKSPFRVLDINRDGRVDGKWSDSGNSRFFYFDTDYNGSFDEQLHFRDGMLIERIGQKYQIKSHYLYPSPGVKNQIDYQLGSGNVVRKLEIDSERSSVKVEIHKGGKLLQSRVEDREISLGPLLSRLFRKKKQPRPVPYPDMYTACLKKKNSLQCMAVIGDRPKTIENIFSEIYGEDAGNDCQDENYYYNGWGIAVDKSCFSYDVMEIERNIREGINSLVQCFAPDENNGELQFPQPLLHQVLEQNYIEIINQGGLVLSCPENFKGKDRPCSESGAVASYVQGSHPTEIALKRLVAMPECLQGPKEHAFKSTPAHEFMHITHALGFDRKIDNLEIAPHNSGPSIEEDRIYSCQFLCFARHRPGFNKKVCEMCLSYHQDEIVGGVPSLDKCKAYK
ncbi:MAG: hypothetical protein HOE90_18205 [Bacteriovoracaceae bacterium]|nr:hypothetical protein [Bacteriovoracaceae bacterium]